MHHSELVINFIEIVFGDIKLKHIDKLENLLPQLPQLLIPPKIKQLLQIPNLQIGLTNLINNSFRYRIKPSISLQLLTKKPDLD